MEIEKHARMTEDAEAKLLEEAVQTSYRKGGESASISSDVVSKETVMNVSFVYDNIITGKNIKKIRVVSLSLVFRSFIVSYWLASLKFS